MARSNKTLFIKRSNGLFWPTGYSLLILGLNREGGQKEEEEDGRPTVMSYLNFPFKKKSGE